MRPRRTVISTRVFRLAGGTEDNDLWVTDYGPDEGGPVIGSTWELSDTERAAIASGANVELLVWGSAQPPVALRLSTYALGKAPPPSPTLGRS
jgi:hypothetical protein